MAVRHVNQVQIQISRLGAHQTETLLLTTNHISVCAQPNQETRSIQAGEELSTKQQLLMGNSVKRVVSRRFLEGFWISTFELKV